MEPNMMTIAMAAKRTNLPEHTIRRRLRSGEYQGSQMGRDWFIYTSEVKRLSKQFPVAV